MTGVDGTAQAGPFGCIALCGRFGDRYEMRCAEVGCGDGSDGKLKSHTWYRLSDDGEFVEA